MKAGLQHVMHVAEFRAALRKFLRQSERAAARRGLTPQRYLLLLMIKGAPDGSQRSTVTDLTERLQVAKHTVTELVGRAEEAGLIHRAASDKDRRIAYLSLTSKGERQLAGLFGDLEADRLALSAVLERMRPPKSSPPRKARS